MAHVFDESLHPRDRDGRFAHRRGVVTVTEGTTGGGIVRQHVVVAPLTAAARAARRPAHDTPAVDFIVSGGRDRPGQRRAGGWEYLDRDAQAAEKIAQFETEMGRPLTAEQATWVRDDLVGPGADPVLRKGTVHIWGRSPRATPEQLQRVADNIDRLWAYRPIDDGSDRVNVSLVDHGEMRDEMTNAETVRGRGWIKLSDRNLDDGNVAHLMPASRTVSRLDYVMAHEWAHATDKTTYDLAEFKLWVDHLGELSTYAEHNQQEARAEAFAEWFLTRGVRPSKPVRAYANHYGWEALP